MVNGGKVRTVFMNDKVITALQEYLKERKSDSPYLFVSRQSNKVSRSRINQLFNKYSNILTPHGGRHYAFTNMAQNGFSLVEIAMLRRASKYKNNGNLRQPKSKTDKRKIKLFMK